MPRITVTHLYPALPAVPFRALRKLLDDALHESDPGPDAYKGLALELTLHEKSLGGDRFVGAIPSDTSAANRAALLGIISRHGAWVELNVVLPDSDSATQRRALRLLHCASLALVRSHPPLALLWGPTGQLMQRAALESLTEGADPLSLFVTVKDEFIGPRRLPALHLAGAKIWLGWALHARLGVLPREAVRQAALAFLHTARDKPELLVAQSFQHAGQSYRISHASDERRIDLIPATAKPLDVRAVPRTLFASRPHQKDRTTTAS